METKFKIGDKVKFKDSYWGMQYGVVDMVGGTQGGTYVYGIRLNKVQTTSAREDKMKLVKGNEDKISYLARIVGCISNNVSERDIDEYENGMFNLVDLPQNPKELDFALDIADNYGLDVEDKRDTECYIKISADKENWIRFNLYQCDEPNYGNKGDINSLDMTEKVYKFALKKYGC